MSDKHQQQKQATLLKHLSQIKQELALQAHLMTLEVKDEWQTIEKRLHEIERQAEHSLEELIQKVGQAEERFFVANEQELDALVEELKALKSKHEKPRT
ncbi:hypothetical protein [Alteromonas sp. a30]|uniref:hypothetical protein n=1 Tax=Alteromonas sp. a30 TaxID=2730917 RepID=UPI0022827873|nr:hypothetical protein [Alteromonas sp. a30]MCY7295555.1 hypothetical protein [Alteromonas sp. a30]